MATSIVRFINWLRINDALITPVDVVGRSHHSESTASTSEGASASRGGTAVAVAEPISKTKTSEVIARLVAEGRIPSSAEDAAKAFYAINQRRATRDEIHDIFITLDELGFIAE